MPIKRVLLLLLLLLQAVSAGADDTFRRILVLNAYHEGYYWTDRIMDGVKSVLGKESDIQVFVDYMDTKRCFDSEYYSKLKNLYEHKYGRMQFDVIIASDDHALSFLLEYRDELFPKVPVVFCGINDFHPDRIRGRTGYTGISESYDVAGTVRMMRSLHPDAEAINFIIDNTLTGYYFQNLIERAEPEFAGQINFKYLLHLDIDELKTALAALPPSELIVWVSYLNTPEGVVLSCEDSLRLVSRNSPLPIYTIWDVVGQGGVIGGKVTSPLQQGRYAAQVALRVLAGESPDGIPVADAELVYQFDDRMLRHFNIPRSRLPKNSIILHQPYSLYAEHREIILLTIGFFIILLFIIVLLAWDILKRRRAESALLLSQSQLRHSEKMSALGQLAGGIAHDFNNQLAGVVGYADLLLCELDDDEQKSFAAGIKKSALRSANLTSQLLAFSRRGKFLSIAVDLHELVIDVTSMLKHSIDKRITISTQLNAAHSQVKGDPNQLQNAILNLALNARDAMPEGGTLTFRTDRRRFDADHTGNGIELPAGDYIALQVRDTGTGMTEEVRKHMFEPFFTTKEVGKGTGMGLASTYGTVRNHQGAIEVKSAPGSGTTITVYLPLIHLPNAHTPPAESTPAPEPAGRNGRILLVDDEAVIQDVTGRILASLGYTVDTCTDGQAAVDFYRANQDQIDLVILDLMMPVLDGRKAYAAIHEINPAVKVILSSGFSVNGEVQELLENGAVDYIAKPYSRNQLAAAVEKALSGS